MPVIPIVTCEHCRHRCDSKSVDEYDKDADRKRSAKVEEDIIDLINFQSYGHLFCSKVPKERCLEPDIEIKISGKQEIAARLEVKYQRRAFMTSFRYVGLQPWATVAFNPKKFRRYLARYQSEHIPTHLVWRIDRTCLGSRFFYQDIEVLEEILNRCAKERKYVRAIGKGDVNAEGLLKGDPNNFHFSVSELKPFDDYMHLLIERLGIGYNKPYEGSVEDSYPEYEFTDADAPPEDLWV